MVVTELWSLGLVTITSECTLNISLLPWSFQMWCEDQQSMTHFRAVKSPVAAAVGARTQVVSQR
jgi:hypothetical protein